MFARQSGETNGSKVVLEKIVRRLPSPYDYWGGNDLVLGRGGMGKRLAKKNGRLVALLKDKTAV